jgi:hypothetical protein
MSSFFMRSIADIAPVRLSTAKATYRRRRLDFVAGRRPDFFDADAFFAAVLAFGFDFAARALGRETAVDAFLAAGVGAATAAVTW